MRILLTNDDGLRAPGIVALHQALAGLGSGFDAPLGDDLVTVAPLTVQSATSHGVTFHQPLMTESIDVTPGMTGIAVDGRPADCVKLALSSIWPAKFGPDTVPDLVVSGMNAGANCGINVIYSGTVAAAIEAAFLGVPSIAVSLHLGKGKADFAHAAGHARRAIEAVIAGGLPSPHECININVPRTEGPDTPMPEIVVCPMNAHGHNDHYMRRQSPRGDDYFWAAGNGLDFRGTDVGSDVHELLDRKITVTPLMYDLTDHQGLGRWRDRLASAPDKA